MKNFILLSVMIASLMFSCKPHEEVAPAPPPSELSDHGIEGTYVMYTYYNLNSPNAPKDTSVYSFKLPETLSKSTLAHLAVFKNDSVYNYFIYPNVDRSDFDYEKRYKNTEPKTQREFLDSNLVYKKVQEKLLTVVKKTSMGDTYIYYWEKRN